MAEAIDTAFVDIRPDFSGFAIETQAGIKRQLAGVSGNVGVGDSRSLRTANREVGLLNSNLGRTSGLARGGAGSMALLGGTAARVGTVGAAGVAGLGVATALGVKAVADASIDFETAFSGVRKTVDATEPELAGLKQDFIDLSTEIPVTAVELAGIGEAAGQLGVQTSAIDEFTETVANLGSTTNLTADVAADALARIANITGLPQDQFSNLGSTIVDLGNKLAATESEIVEFGLRIAGAGTQVGLSEQEILSIGGALASVGLEAEAGGTAISTTLVKIASAVASGGKKLEAFATVAGQSGEEFAKSFGTDPAQALVAFVSGLGKVDDAGGNVFATLESLGLGGIRVRDALLRSSNAGDLLARSLEIGDEAFKSNIALSREASIRYETTASKITLLKNEINALAIELGDRVGPAIGDGASALQGLVGDLRDNESVASTLRSGLDNLRKVAEPLFGVFERNKDVIVDTFKNAGESIRVTIALLKPVAYVVGVTLVAAFEAAFFILDKVNKVSRLFGDAMEASVTLAVDAVDLFLGALGFLASAIDAIPGVDMSGTVSAIEGARSSLQGFVDDLNGVDGKTVTTAVTLDLPYQELFTFQGALAATQGMVPGRDEGGGPKAPAAFGEPGFTPDAGKGVKTKPTPIDLGGAVADVPKTIAAKEQKLQDNLALAQAIDESIANDKRALGVLANFYDEQAANEDLKLAVRRQFQIKAEQSRQAIRQLDAQAASDAQADNDAAVRSAEDRADANESARQAQLQANLRLAQSTENTLEDDIRAQSAINVDLKRQIRAAKDGSAAERELRTQLRIEKSNLAALRLRQQERLDETKLDAIRDAETLASFTKTIVDDQRALRAEEKYWLRKVAGEKRGSIARRKYRIELERTRKEIRELREGEKETVDETTKGTSIVDLLTENAKAVAGFASNIGQAGIDPLSGFDANSSLVAMLSRQQRAPSAARETGVEGFQGAADRLVAALDRNTKAREGGNVAASTSETEGFNVNRYASVLGARSNAQARFWDAARARRIAEESTSG